MQIALYQPDIPQNVGSIIRLCACMGVTCHIIEPCGFLLDDKRLKRVAMDYTAQAAVQRHSSWGQFASAMQGARKRIILLSTKAKEPYWNAVFGPHDILLLGRESAGVPPEVAATADLSLTIPMAEGTRSLNVALAAAIVLGEGVRQINQ